MITPEQIEADLKLCEAATPGPWLGGSSRSEWDNKMLIVLFNCLKLPENMNFIAAARTALPKYIAEVKRLAAKVEELEKERNLAIKWSQATQEGCDALRAERDAARADQTTAECAALEDQKDKDAAIKRAESAEHELKWYKEKGVQHAK